jgi:hypothetical protein
MRRTLIMTIASTFVLAVAPGAALAHNHGGKHKGHHHRSHVKKFGSDSQSGGSNSSSDTAGTVASFSGGVLTIKLNDGSMVSGKVTNDTEIECKAPEQSQTTGDDDNGPGDDSTGDGDHQGSASSTQRPGSDASDVSGDNDANEGQNEDQGQAACDSSALTPNTVVRGAELSISSGGATWKKVELQK